MVVRENVFEVSVKNLESGDVDPFGEGLMRLLEASQQDLIVDLSRVDYATSYALGRLLQFSDDARKSGKRVRVRVKKHLQEVIEGLYITGFVFETATD